MIWKIVAGIVRHVLTVLGGSLVTQGWLQDEQLTAGVGALLTLLGIAWSVWQKSRTRTVPGGEFNKRAAVRKARGVGGYAYGWPVSVAALVCSALALALALGLWQCQAQASREWSWQEMMEHRDAMLAQQRIEIFWSDVVDRRPFLARLLESLRIAPVSVDLSDRSDSSDSSDGSDLSRVRWQISGGAEF